MSKRSSDLLLGDILESAKKIQKFTKEMSFQKFSMDEKTIDAVIRNLEIIGEAAKFIPESLQNKYSDLPVSDMVGMRNLLIHN